MRVKIARLGAVAEVQHLFADARFGRRFATGAASRQQADGDGSPGEAKELSVRAHHDRAQ
jgi:hypothetical protein